MSGKIIVFCVIVLILILVVYLFNDSDMIAGMKQSGKSVVKKVDYAKEGREIEITGGPVLQVKNPGEKGYHTVTITKKEFKIGRSKKSDLALDFRTIEDKHAVIVKKLKGDKVFFEFINYAKTNPTEYYNKQKDAFEYLGYKDGVELDARECFYVGDTKMIVVVPSSGHMPTDTERIEPYSAPTEEINSVNRAESTRVFCKENKIYM